MSLPSLGIDIAKAKFNAAFIIVEIESVMFHRRQSTAIRSRSARFP
jgi:hypothetical protein